MAEINIMQDHRLNHNERAVGINPGTGTAEIQVRINDVWTKVKDVTEVEVAILDVRAPFRVVTSGDASVEVY